MKITKIIFLAFAIPVMFINHSKGQNGWTKLPNFPAHGRQLASSFAINGYGYVGGGDTSSDPSMSKWSNDFWQFDPSKNTWTQKANIPGNPRAGAICFAIGNKGFIGSGNNDNDFWEYDPNSDTWTQKLSSIYPTLGPRIGSSCFTIGAKGYTAFGFGSQGNLGDLLEYDTTLDKWTGKAIYPGYDRNYTFGFSIGNKGFLGGGMNASGNYFTDFYEYDMASDSWTQKANIPTAGMDAGISFNIGATGYIGFGNITGEGYSNEMWSYDTTTNRWTQMPSPASDYKVYSPFAFSIGEYAYVGSGYASNNVTRNDFYEFNPKAAINPNQNQDVSFEIYPNPSHGNFIIKSAYNIDYFDICDINGKLVYKCLNPENGNMIHLDLSLHNGSYLVRVISKQGVSVEKLVVTGN